MKLSVIKTGYEPLDYLHASGLAVWVAETTDRAVQLDDVGPAYCLQFRRTSIPNLQPQLMNKVLALPTDDMLEAFAQKSMLQHSVPVPMANFDGLLTALYTTRGVRALSINNLVGLSSFDKSVFADAQIKVWDLRRRVDTYLRRRLLRQAEITRLYNFKEPEYPKLVTDKRGHLVILMTIAPALSSSVRPQASRSRRATSRPAWIIQPILAPVLVLIGAARFLRAQHVAGKQVNCYVPVSSRAEVTPQLTLPILGRRDVPSRQALAAYLVDVARTPHPISWTTLYWHTLQRQGMRQSFCIGQGAIDAGRFLLLAAHLEKRVLGRWQAELYTVISPSGLTTRRLVDCLVTLQSDCWFQHWQDVARRVETTYYNFSTIKEICKSMADTDSEYAYLKEILDREAGTLRLGRALRLLSRYHRPIAQEVITKLRLVRSLPQLMDALYHLAAMCELSQAKTNFIIVPNETDFALLLGDIERVGLATIVAFVIMLSSWGYNRTTVTEGQSREPSVHSDS